MRPLTELTNTNDPAWPRVQAWIAEAPHVEVLAADEDEADAALLQLQVTLRSPMGAVVHHTGGLLVEHGWLRVLGCGSRRLPRSLPGWNDGKAPLDATRRPTFLLIADDVLGGLFAINGGALGNELGMVFYLAPDTLDWENLALGYSEFLAWALSRGLSEFYQHLRWPGWQDEVAKIAGDRALSVYPFLWAEGPSIEERSRRAVPAEELYRLTMDMRQQLAR